MVIQAHLQHLARWLKSLFSPVVFVVSTVLYSLGNREAVRVSPLLPQVVLASHVNMSAPLHGTSQDQSVSTADVYVSKEMPIQ